jgi:hypothetical protein
MERYVEPATLTEFVVMLETHLLGRGWVKDLHPDVPRRYKKVTGSLGPHPRGDFDITTSLSVPENCRLGPRTYGGSVHDVALLTGIYQNQSMDTEWIWKFDAQSFTSEFAHAQTHEYQCFLLNRYVSLNATFTTFQEFYAHMLAKIEEKSQVRM